MNQSIKFFFVFTILVAFACNQSNSQQESERQVPHEEKAVEPNLPPNASFTELMEVFPELELPFALFALDSESTREAPKFASYFREEYTYSAHFEQHPEMRIPNELAHKFLDTATTKLARFDRTYPSTKVFPIGRINRESFVILVYNVAKKYGDSPYAEGAPYIEEYKITTVSKNGDRLGSHHFGFESSTESEDHGTAELLPDLTAVVYDNPWCLEEDLPCREDHYITILPDGQMKVKSKSYE